MAVYCIEIQSGRNTISVTDYLSNPSIRPPFPNPGTRIRELINGHGIVHYTRSGTRTPVTNPSFNMRAGDFLVVADNCATGQSCTVRTISRKDHVFVMPDDVEDPFALYAENYYSLRPNTNLIGWRAQSLDRLIRAICTDSDVNCPINDLYCVTHASESGFYFPKDSQDTDTFLEYEELCDYIAAQSRPVINSRIIQNNAHLYIKGCKLGEDRRYLTKLRELFGNQISVSAPKHIDSYGLRENTTTQSGQVTNSTNHYYEYMSYCFKVFSRTAITNKNQLIQSLRNKHFTDIYGTEITQAQYTNWVPSSINRTSSRRFSCRTPIQGLAVTIDFKYRLKNVFIAELEFENPADVPSGTANRMQALRTEVSQNELMQSGYSYPYYERWGYQDFDTFWNGLTWGTPQWNASTSVLSSQGKRYEYELRVPITGPDSSGNNLLLNAFLDSGQGAASSYVQHDIVETDSRLFGSVP